MYWQAHISHSHPNLDFFTLLNFCFLSLFVFSRFFFSLLTCSTWFLTLLAFISLDIYSNIYFSLCFSFDTIQLFLCFFLNLSFFNWCFLLAYLSAVLSSGGHCSLPYPLQLSFHSLPLPLFPLSFSKVC